MDLNIQKLVYEYEFCPSMLYIIVHTFKHLEFHAFQKFYRVLVFEMFSYFKCFFSFFELATCLKIFTQLVSIIYVWSS